jgi:nicotinate-nucleotide pyrophosphorylase (carboxylating)
MSKSHFESWVREELETDRFHDDVTANLLLDKALTPGKAILRSREDGVFSGVPVVEAFSEIFRNSVQFSLKVAEGDRIKKEQVLVTLEGPLGKLLSLERTLLNFLGLSCGVASLTRKFVEAVRPYPVQILATRKTIPGLRELQLSAVVAGGGRIHRRSLSDGILIKDNHTALVKEELLLERAHATRSPLHGIEIEVQNFSSLEAVLQSTNSPDIIMLDNFSVVDMKEAVSIIRQKNSNCRIEASGGVSLESVAAIAATGVDTISVGRITHSASCLNLTLDFET